MNTIVIFFLFLGSLVLCPHRLGHMKLRSIGLILGLLADTKLSKMRQNVHMTMQLLSRAYPHILNNPPVPQTSKEVHHPLHDTKQHCTSTVQAALVSAIVITYFIIKQLTGCSRRQH